MSIITANIDYKKELEAASKGMIMIHDPKLLIKLIIRTIVGKVRLKHASVMLYEPERNAYILTISKGERGLKIPAGFARFAPSHPLIRIFTDSQYRHYIGKRNAFLYQDLTRLLWQESVFPNTDRQMMREALHGIGEQMRRLNIVGCVPAFYQDKLMAVLLLGEKVDGRQFSQVEIDFFSALASDAAMAIRNAQLFNSLRQESQRNHDLFLRTTIVLGSTIEAKDKYTHGHTERVTNYAMAIARQMNAAGASHFDQSFFESLYVAGMLHDIGKIAIPESILNKVGQLTPEEFEIMKEHTLHGVEILRPLSELKASMDGVKYHHERYDGQGYPEGLKGESIPPIAAIITVADAYDAMTSDRPYRKGLAREDALRQIEDHIGTQFNAKPAQALIALIRSGKI